MKQTEPPTSAQPQNQTSNRPRTSSVIAVDGGGTRCRMVLQNADTRHQVEGGSVNVSTDFHGAVAELSRCLEHISRQARIPMEELIHTPAYLGLAGIIGPDVVPRLRQALPFTHVKIEDDQPAAVKAVLGKDDGYLVHCGTGSFLASQIGGHMRFVGGWGNVLGDAGSAMWVGRMSLSLSLEVVDGLRPATDLSRSMLDRLNGAEGIVQFAATATPAEFGKLAPEITRCAERDDAIALEVMRSTARILAQTLQQMGWTPGQPLCLTGGIGPAFAPYLPASMQDHLTAAKGVPIEGALMLAQAFAQEGQT